MSLRQLKQTQFRGRTLVPESVKIPEKFLKGEISTANVHKKAVSTFDSVLSEAFPHPDSKRHWYKPKLHFLKRIQTAACSFITQHCNCRCSVAWHFSSCRIICLVAFHCGYRLASVKRLLNAGFWNGGRIGPTIRQREAACQVAGAGRESWRAVAKCWRTQLWAPHSLPCIS